MSWPAEAQLPLVTLLQEEGWAQCLCCWCLSGCSRGPPPPCSSSIRSLETLMLPSERDFQPLAPPELSTLAKVITATCPTRAWEVLTTMKMLCSIHCTVNHVPTWMPIDQTKS